MAYSKMKEEQTTLLKGYSQEEKAAYFGALATVAAADGHASDEELEYLEMMGEAAALPDNVQQELVSIARNPSQLNLQQCLEVLKKSQLRFSFVSDIISFAKADGKYTAEEQQHIQQMSDYLNINQEQFSILDQFVNKANDAQQHGEDPTSQAFLHKNGLEDRFKKAGISPQMIQGMLGILAPMVLSKMMGGRRKHGMKGGGLLGSLLGGSMYRSGGGLGSIISILGGLNGRRGYSSMGSGGLGSMLGKILSSGKHGRGW